MLQQAKNASFFIGPEESNTACLLIHGFNGTPLEMRGLGGTLADACVYVYALAMARHMGNPQDLLYTSHSATWCPSRFSG